MSCIPSAWCHTWQTGRRTTVCMNAQARRPLRTTGVAFLRAATNGHRRESFSPSQHCRRLAIV